MTLYNITYVANSTSLLTFIQRVDSQLMGNMFGTLMIIAIFAIIFMSVLKITNEAGKSLAVASFICFGLSLMLRGLDLVGELTMFILVIVAAASVAIIKNE